MALRRRAVGARVARGRRASGAPVAGRRRARTWREGWREGGEDVCVFSLQSGVCWFGFLEGGRGGGPLAAFRNCGGP